MIAKNHSVVLAGAGIRALALRVSMPIAYWRAGYGKQTIRLWLLDTPVTRLIGNIAWNTEREQRGTAAHPYVDAHHDVFGTDTTGVTQILHTTMDICSNSAYNMLKCLNQTTMPTLATWPMCSTKRTQPQDTRWSVARRWIQL